MEGPRNVAVSSLFFALSLASSRGGLVLQIIVDEAAQRGHIFFIYHNGANNGRKWVKMDLPIMGKIGFDFRQQYGQLYG